jgi:quercetin dioxygenase-like cupin family protein
VTKPLWFFDELVHIRVSRDDTGDRFSVLEVAVPPASPPPLHVHHTEDEAFYVLEGSARFHVGGEVHDAKSGDALLVRKGTPHTFFAGDEGARFLVTSSPGDFERFVVAAGRPAEASELPPPAPGPPTAEEQEAMGRLAAEHGSEILGPPGALPS